MSEAGDSVGAAPREVDGMAEERGTTSTVLDGELLELDGWDALDADERPDLPPLPGDPMPPEAFDVEPAWPGMPPADCPAEDEPLLDHLPSDVLAGILPGP